MNLTDNEHLKEIVESAPIGVAILEAATLKVEILNAKFLEIAGKPKDAILNKWYWEPFAEVRAYYENALNDVVATGEPYYADEVKMMLIRHGREEWIYVTFVYAPVKNAAGEVTKIAVWVLENTRQVTERQKAEAAKAAFREERDRLQRFFMQAPAGICILSGPELVYELVNPSYQELLPGRALLGRPIFEALPELVGTPLEKILKNVYYTGEDFRINELLIPVSEYEGGPTRDRYFTFNYTARKNQEGEIDGVMAFVYEVTAIAQILQEQKEVNDQLTAVNEELTAANEALYTTQENLQEANIRLNFAMEAGSLGSTEVVFATGEMQASPQFKKNFGRKENETFNYADLFEAIVPEYREEIRRRVQHAIASDTIYTAEYPVTWPDGSTHWISAFGKPRYDENGVATRIVGLTADITERVLTQKVIEESEARFRSLAEGSEVMISVNDIDGNVLFVNQAWLNLTGKTQEQMQDYGWGEFLHPDDQEQLLKDFRAGIASRKSFTVEFRMLTATGEPRYIYTKIHPRLLADGDYAGTISSSIDITERVIANQALQKLNNELAETNHRLNIALEAANFGTWHINSKTRELIANDRLRELFGFHPGETITVAGCIAQITDDYRDEVSAAIEHAITQGGDYDLSYKVSGYHDQQIRWLRAVGNLKVDASGEFSAFTGVIMDITEQVNALDTIKESEELYRKIAAELRISRDETQLAIDAASLATFDLNPVTGKFKGNHLIKEWFGLQADDEIELDKAVLVIAEEDREQVQKAIADALDYEQGGRYEISYTIVNPLDRLPRVVKAKGETLFNEQREPVRLSGVLQDITEQRKDEERKNDFIAMVSHELKTPLTSLLGYVQMLEIITREQGDQKLSDLLDKSVAQVKKMNIMITGFLDMSRFHSGKIHLEKQQFLLNRLLTEVVADTLLIYRHHEIIFTESPEVRVTADRDKIGQVVTNLLSNAVKYSPRGKKITVSCQIEADKAMVSVTDEGVGISKANMARLFDRFYRVEGKQAETIGGFGIGLYISAEIIERHQGEIGVDSEQGRGSTFYFKIPL
jgi:two-component system sensor histidine kinase VicK